MKTILLAEDEVDLRLVIRTTLESPQYRILEADDGQAALDIARREKLDLVLLDWMMPGVSGITVAEELRKSPDTANVPIIMVTARSQRADRERGAELGTFAYLVKPFSPLELLHVVEEALS
ncbi:MAG: response regulator [Acidobacteria bacterium]|nr:response regulator [Acidobacteriota bacterium]